MNEFLEVTTARQPGRSGNTLIPSRSVERRTFTFTFSIRDKPTWTMACCARPNDLWEEAERLAAGDPAVLRRVQISRTSVDYAIMDVRGPI